MSGNKLLDTNILIHLSKKNIELDAIINPEESIFISVITYMEALGFSFKKKEEEDIMNRLCNDIPIIHLTTEIAEEVIKTKRNHKIKLPDAVIFSTAKVHHLELVTANIADFKGLNGKVTITNPIT